MPPTAGGPRLRFAIEARHPRGPTRVLSVERLGPLVGSALERVFSCTLRGPCWILVAVTPRTLEHQDVVRLVQQHQVEVWRYLRFLGASTELADDLCQETFLQLLRAPFVERAPSATAAWLRMVARNLYVKSFRRPPFALAEAETIEAAWTGFARDDAGRESLEALRTCVQQLEGRARDVVRMHYEERRSRRDIGERLGIGEDGVKSLLRRTRSILRECIERHREGA